MATTIRRSDELLAREDAALADVMKIRFYPFSAASARGVRMTDADGREYLDMTGSGGVPQTGYGHPAVREALVAALDGQHTAMLCCHSNAPATDLAEQLCALLPGDFAKKAWFGTSGSDANDCIARLLPLATGRRRLVSFVGGYHGTTSGSAALSGHQAQASVIGGGNVTKVPYPDPYRCLHGPCSREGCSLKCLEHVERYALGAVSPAADTAAIVVEAVQSDGGEVVPPENFLPRCASCAIATASGWCSTRSRSGWGGPGGCSRSSTAAWSPTPSRSASRSAAGCRCRRWWVAASCSTWRPSACSRSAGRRCRVAGGLATLRVIEAEGLVANAAAMGRRLLEGLEAIAGRSTLIGDVAGAG